VKKLLITGCGKSGTSTLLGILNTHPRMFILFEAYLHRNGGPLPRGREFLSAFPRLASSLPSGGGFEETYEALGVALNRGGEDLAVIGDKILIDTLNAAHRRELCGLPSIFMVRDVRSWLCKNVVVMDYHEPGGLVRKAAAYVDAFLETFLWRQCLRISMEQLILDWESLLPSLETFISLEIRTHARRWWKKVGEAPAGSAKAAVLWWNGHDSAQLKPSRLDTTFKLKDHWLWNTILPIFEKYSSRLESNFPSHEVNADRESIRGMESAPITLEDLYEEASSVSFGAGMFGSSGHRSTNPHVRPLKI
jgi:hypothetical protein